MSTKSKNRQRIYSGDEARELFEELYFTEPATSCSDDSDTGTSSVSSLSSSNDGSKVGDEPDEEVRLEVNKSAHRDYVCLSGEDPQTNELDSRNNSFTEVDVPFSDSDCYITEVAITSNGPDERDSGDNFTEVDFPLSETECYITEGDIASDVTGSGTERGAFSGEDEGVDDIMDIEAERGRKRTRVHFVDNDSDSSCISIVSSSAKKRRKNKSSRELSSILRMKCCRNYCLHKISRKEVAYSRNAFQEQSKCEQRKWILQYLLEHHEESGSDVKVLFTIGVTEVCERGWRLALGISRTRLWQIKSHFQDGLKAYLPPNHHRRGMQSRTVTLAMMWLDRFSSRFGDKLPSQSKIHLPSCLTRASVYNTMKEEIADDGQEVCSKVHFLRMWRRELAHVSIPKVNRFSKCDTCTELKQSMEKTNDKEARQKLHQKREVHLTQQKTERLKYYKHTHKARQNPEKYISVIIDGMDQKSTQIPKFFRTSKSVSSAWRLPTHITGAIVHGRGQHMFVDAKEFPHDSNLTATILLQVLNKYSTNLPDTLYLQLDNCWRENKNQCILGLCALLVELNVFKKVKLCFLMKGHTHEDIDQLFSRISTHTSKHNIPTLSSLLHHIPKSYNKPNTSAERIHTMYNVRDWLHTQINKPSHHSFPHQFKITKVEGKAVIQTKKWSSSPAWQSTIGEASHILTGHPTGNPQVVERKVEDLHIDRLHRDMAKYRPYLNESEHQEWMELLNSFQVEDDGSHHHWPLLDILMAKDATLANQQIEPHADTNLSNDEQDPIPPVNLGRKVCQRRQPVVPQIGQMVCVFLEEFRNEWPQIGKITSLQHETSVLHWYSGTTTTQWTPLDRPVLTQTGLREPYLSTVPKSSFITGSFIFTGLGKLPQEIQRQLKEKREEIYH